MNQYGRQLTPGEIECGVHREFVGGLWDELGQLQLDFMVGRGLGREHRLLDMGCGALRGGLHLIRYLETGHYFGLDINASLIQAGRMEIRKAGLREKQPRLAESARFDATQFGVEFDYALAVSVFTHLDANQIVRCLSEIRRVLRHDGEFYATFFEAPHDACITEVHHHPGAITTHYDRDPFHCTFGELQGLARLAGLTAEYVGNWNHPRSQRMVVFRP